MWSLGFSLTWRERKKSFLTWIFFQKENLRGSFYKIWNIRKRSIFFPLWKNGSQRKLFIFFFGLIGKEVDKLRQRFLGQKRIYFCPILDKRFDFSKLFELNKARLINSEIFSYDFIVLKDLKTRSRVEC